MGTHLLEVADAASNSLAWRGVANAHVGRRVSDAGDRERLDKAATKMPEQFPPIR